MSKLEMLTPQNSAIALIDYQPAMYQGVQSHDRIVVFNNIQILAKAAKLFKIPTVLSTVAKDSFSGPFMPEVTDLFPNHDIIDRTSMNSWLDAGFRKAVAATGRKKFVIAGLWTEACVMFPTIDMLREGYEISFARSTQPLDGSRGAGRGNPDHVLPIRVRAAAGLGAPGNLRRRDEHPARAFSLRHPGPLLEVGAGRTRLRRRSQGGRIAIVGFAIRRSAMKIYLLSAGAGILVGVIYSLLNVRSPAPPLVALVGLLGILIGEQVIPVGKQLLSGNGLAAAWRQAQCAPHIFGLLPGRQADTAATPNAIEEKRS